MGAGADAGVGAGTLTLMSAIACPSTLYELRRWPLAGKNTVQNSQHRDARTATRRRTILQGQSGILRVNSRDHAVYERVWRVLQSHNDRDADEARRHDCRGVGTEAWELLALTTSPELAAWEVVVRP